MYNFLGQQGSMSNNIIAQQHKLSIISLRAWKYTYISWMPPIGKPVFHAHLQSARVWSLCVSMLRGWDRKSKNMHTPPKLVLFTRGISRRVLRRVQIFCVFSGCTFKPFFWWKTKSRARRPRTRKRTTAYHICVSHLKACERFFCIWVRS